MTRSGGPPPEVAVVIAAAGAGVRLGPGAPKALRLLGGEPLLSHAVRRVAAATSVGYLVVSAPRGEEETVREIVRSALAGRGAGSAATAGNARPTAPAVPAVPAVTVVAGGAERQRSVAAALAVVPPEFDIVLVHDAARALTPASLMDDVAAAVRAGHDAVIPVLPVTDTVVQVDTSGVAAGGLDRARLRAVQTPQGFRRAVLVRAHSSARGTGATDDAGLVADIGIPVHTVPGSPRALKITTPDDLAYAEALLACRTLRG
jgi:2-C-methyl-D-erythritol 4-phosphate cytidylyltransferase